MIQKAVALIGLFIFPSVLVGQDGKFVDPVPGSMYTMIPDDDVLIWFGVAQNTSPSTSSLGTTNSTVTVLNTQGLPFSLPNSVAYEGLNAGLKSAAGRVITSEADQLIVVTKQNFQTDPLCATITYQIDGFINPNVSSASFPSFTKDVCLVGGNDIWPDSPFAITAGELFKQVAADGEFHDEVIFVGESGDAKLNPNGGLRVLVLDYGATSGQVTPTELIPDWSGAGQIHGIYKNASEAFPGAVQVDTFDGRADGSRLIVSAHAATWQENGAQQYGVALSVFEYAGPGKLTSLGAWGLPLSATALDVVPLSGCPFALATGDFNGDGRDEVAAVITQGTSTGPDGNLLQKNLFILGLNSEDQLEILNEDGWTSEDGLMPGCNNNLSLKGQNGCSNIQLASGLFEFDPENGFDLTRRQLAFAWMDNNLGFPIVHIYQINADNSKTTIASSYPPFNAAKPQKKATNPGILQTSLSLQAGNYAGVDQIVDDQNPPLWQLMLGTNQQATNSSLSAFVLQGQPGNVTLNQTIVQSYPFTNNSEIPFSQFQALDFDGDSIYLGAPIVFDFESMSNVVSVLEQPPAHFDYLPNACGANANTGLTAISQSNNFLLVLNQNETQTLSSSQQSTVSATYGASTQETASATLSDLGDILSGSISADIQAKQDYNLSNSTISSQGQSSTLEFDTSNAPTSDDAVAMFVAAGQIWRYRIYGAQNSDPNNPNLFYEIYIPQTTNNNPIWLPGLSLQDIGYQPLHENGNILSYPDLGSGNKYTPPDMGAWSLPDSCGGSSPTVGPIAQSPILTFGGMENSWSPKFTASSTCDQQRSNSQSMQQSQSQKVSVKVNVTAVFASADVSASYEYSTAKGYSWSGLTTYQNTSTTADCLLIKAETTENCADYQFSPTVYFADNGAAKVVFSVGGIPANADDFWATYYSGVDPALNLPNKYLVLGDDSVTFNTDTNARRLRGLFARDATQINAATGLGPTLNNQSLPWSTQVQFEVMVYNYSVKSSFQDLNVRFDVALFDENSQSFSDRQTIGMAVADYTDEHTFPDGPSKGTTFPPRGVGRAVVNLTLDPTTLPGGDPTKTQIYALFAVLNPDGEIPNETHPWREPTVGIIPYTNGQPGVGDTIAVQVLDDSGQTVTTVSVISTGTAPTDVANLAEAFSQSILASDYQVQATHFPSPEIPVEGDEPFMVILSAANTQVPASAVSQATLAFTQPVKGTSSLTFLPSIQRKAATPAGTPTISASNLAIGQNNEGYGLFTVVPAQSSANLVRKQ